MTNLEKLKEIELLDDKSNSREDIINILKEYFDEEMFLCHKKALENDEIEDVLAFAIMQFEEIEI